MNSRFGSRSTALIVMLVWLLASASLLMAQDAEPKPIKLANPMGTHTWFIILAVGAFLAWSVSYSLELHRQALKRRSAREGFAHQKSQLFDQIAKLEAAKESGEVTAQQYNQEFKKLKSRLSRMIEQPAQNDGGPAER